MQSRSALTSVAVAVFVLLGATVAALAQQQAPFDGDIATHGLRPSHERTPYGNTNFDFSLLNVKNESDVQLPTISRDEVMQRAKEWTDKRIPYCQCNGPQECCGSCPYCSQYRCDCSGYVSYCWGLSHGYTTYTLPEVAHPIEKDELREGDVLLDVNEHVVLFAGWANSDHTHYIAYQEPGCHTSGPHYAYSSTVPYPFSWNPSAFKPYRYKGIQ